MWIFMFGLAWISERYRPRQPDLNSCCRRERLKTLTGQEQENIRKITANPKNSARSGYLIKLGSHRLSAGTTIINMRPVTSKRIKGHTPFRISLMSVSVIPRMT